MLQRSIVLFGCLVSSGTIAFASSAIAQPPVPVVRANGFTKQVPSCYIETTNGGFQNLDANCLMGKVPDPEMFDMVTDRDGDGIPDDLMPLFKQMEAMNKVSSSTPEGRDRAAAQMQKVFQTMAQRTPVTAATRRNLNEIGELMTAFSKVKPFKPGTAPDAPDAKLMKQYERLFELSKQLDKDPIMNKINAYSQRYNANQAMKK
jgi:hypothetical protein